MDASFMEAQRQALRAHMVAEALAHERGGWWGFGFRILDSGTSTPVAEGCRFATDNVALVWLHRGRGKAPGVRAYAHWYACELELGDLDKLRLAWDVPACKFCRHPTAIHVMDNCGLCMDCDCASMGLPADWIVHPT